MGSNNYAEVIVDEFKVLEVRAMFERLANNGWSFKVLEFAPGVDRFPISCGRESNFPPLPNVEEFGTAVAGTNAQVFWSKNPGSVEAVNFGNGHVGLFCDAGVAGYMVIVDNKQQASKCGSIKFDAVTESLDCCKPPVYAEADRASGEIVGYCPEHFAELMLEERKNHATPALDPGEDL